MTSIMRHRTASVATSALIAVLFLPGESLAQDASQDGAAGSARDAEGTGTIARYRDRYRSLKDKGIAFSLGSILPGASFSAGVGLERNRLFGTILGASAEGEWSIRGYHRYDLRFGLLRGREHRAELDAADADVTSVFNDNSLLAFGTSVFVEWRGRVYPRIDFFGPGQNSSVDDRSDFGLHGSSLDLVVQWQRDAHFGLSGRVGTLKLHLEPGTNRGVPNTADTYSSLEAPGLDVQPRYVTAGVAATLDYRDRPRLTSEGTFASVGVWQAFPDDGADDSARWRRVVADVRHFHRLHGSEHVLALHGLVSTRAGGGDTPTPFYLRPTLGGSKTLRGFGSYRLRDEAVWAATAEYRWRAHRWVEIAPFVDVGSVATSFAGLRDAGVAASPGIGVRALSSTRVIGRADLARGRDGARIVLTLSTPF